MQKYFSGNYVFPSPKSSKEQKKGIHRKLKSLCPRNQVKTKKREKSSPQFGTKLGRNLWDLFEMAGPFSSNQPALKSRWGTLNLDGGMLTLDGGTHPPASPLQFKY